MHYAHDTQHQKSPQVNLLESVSSLLCVDLHQEQTNKNKFLAFLAGAVTDLIRTLQSGQRYAMPAVAASLIRFAMPKIYHSTAVEY